MSGSGTIKAPNNSTVMAVGTNPNGSNPTSPYFNGKIYSVAVYNRALSASEVKQNAIAGMYVAGESLSFE